VKEWVENSVGFRGMESHYTLAKKDVLRFVGLLLLTGSLIGVGIGAITFSGSQTTITQRLTVTNVVTSLQQIQVIQTQFVTITQTSMTTSAATTGWREIKRFTGSATLTTEPFAVSSNMWRIKWSYGPAQSAFFSFFAYQVGESMYVDMVSSGTPSGSGTTYIYKGPGDFYLKIISGVPYTIIVEVPA
jgi:hypothetical protein